MSLKYVLDIVIKSKHYRNKTESNSFSRKVRNKLSKNAKKCQNHDQLGNMHCLEGLKVACIAWKAVVLIG